MNKIISKFISSLFLVAAIPCICVSCTKTYVDDQGYYLTLISDAKDGFKLSNNQEMEPNKEFVTSIVKTKPESNIFIENINILSPNGFLEPSDVGKDGDYEVIYADDFSSASLKIFKPTPGLFVLLSSSNSNAIVSDNKKVNLYPSQDISHTAVLQYNDLLEPESDITCDVWSTDSNEYTCDNFIVDNVSYSKGTHKIYVSINTQNIPQISDDEDVNLVLRLSYQMYGIIFHRFASIKVTLKKGFYQPILLDQEQASTITIYEHDITEYDYAFQVNLRFNSTFSWLPVDNKIFGAEIVVSDTPEYIDNSNTDLTINWLNNTAIMDRWQKFSFSFVVNNYNPATAQEDTKLYFWLHFSYFIDNNILEDTPIEKVEGDTITEQVFELVIKKEESIYE